MFVMSQTDLPLPPWRTPRKTRRATQLSQDTIVDAAFALLDDEGVAGVTMRRVAQALDTGPASLYAHVANKEELVQLMIDRLNATITVPEPDADRWREQIKDIAWQAYRAYGAHIDIASALLATIPTGPNTLRISDGLLAILLTAGVPPQEASWFLDRLFLYIAADAYEGSIHQVKQRASGMDATAYMAEFVEPIRTYFASLPPDRFPYLTANVEAMTTGSGDTRFEFGLEILINGIAAYAAPA